MSQPLTIMTWLWQQRNSRADYKPRYVNYLKRMIAANLKLDHEFACVTRITDGLDKDIRVIKPPTYFQDVVIPSWSRKGLPQCMRRVAMFHPEAEKLFGTKRFVNIDTDVVVTGDLTPLFDRDDDFIMYRGLHKKRPYNGSLLMMNAGARPAVFKRFSEREAIKAGSLYVGSDQAWISHVLGWGEATWTHDDGVVCFHQRAMSSDPKLVFFPGPSKPWRLTDEPIVRQHYPLVAPVGATEA